METGILRKVDQYGVWFILRILSLFKKSSNRIESKPRRILVIRLWALGSSLLTFPLIEELRRLYPKADFSLLATTRNISFFQNQEYFSASMNLFRIRDVFRLIASFNKYDLVVDTEEYFRISALVAYWCGKQSIWYGNIPGRSIDYSHPIRYNDTIHSIHASLELLSPLGFNMHSYSGNFPKLRYTEKQQEMALSILKPYIKKTPKIIFHAGWAETSPERFWKAEHWIQLTTLIASHFPHCIIFLSGTPFEREINTVILSGISEQYHWNVVNMCGKTNVFELAAFMEECDLMISNDTWPMHLSACMGTPTIWLFWPNLPERFWPYPPEKHATLYKWNGVPSINVHLGEFKKCNPEIMDRISPTEVFEKVVDLLERRQA